MSIYRTSQLITVIYLGFSPFDVSFMPNEIKQKQLYFLGKDQKEGNFP